MLSPRLEAGNIWVEDGQMEVIQEGQHEDYEEDQFEYEY